jgi:hypothetical protein
VRAFKNEAFKFLNIIHEYSTNPKSIHFILKHRKFKWNKLTITFKLITKLHYSRVLKLAFFSSSEFAIQMIFFFSGLKTELIFFCQTDVLIQFGED